MASSIVLKVTYLAMMIVCITLCQISSSSSSSLTQAYSPITCGHVQVTLAPCLSYLRRDAKKIIPKRCCDGVKKVNGETKTKEDRQSVCNCIKRTAQNIRGLNLHKLVDLPENCGVHTSTKIAPSTDCNKSWTLQVRTMPHKTRPMTALLVFTGLNVVLCATIAPVYDFVCFLPYWERRRERRRLEREAAKANNSN
ncbi:hypothetical protein PIB30_031079 [Stylosanthes scabra]|uniref:Non-specific lipid-transfer protein n=1 Tax=Stylosanthes scabra TaxID=79078 RepID=A0ABU6TDM2_9FABA|nr:hypothetical protein [Stylosanthes scabra]